METIIGNPNDTKAIINIGSITQLPSDCPAEMAPKISTTQNIIATALLSTSTYGLEPAVIESDMLIIIMCVTNLLSEYIIVDAIIIVPREKTFHNSKIG